LLITDHPVIISNELLVEISAAVGVTVGQLVLD